MGRGGGGEVLYDEERKLRDVQLSGAGNQEARGEEAFVGLHQPAGCCGIPICRYHRRIELNVLADAVACDHLVQVQFDGVGRGEHLRSSRRREAERVQDERDIAGAARVLVVQPCPTRA